ncbi:MAG: bifunctional 2-polyprenyl-6-hydroxyphenol methylase/3-demethylubiquinol 3-O-methyltransferase UbiG [Rhodospirillaceae bacterium]|nr:bifunctional 2-polyprenyl-6-hydroxyphenol methylase/3-demethylubiquinol 3-O-methyltransferase UbiG [Rhodospirillaceae bacterium]
MSATSATLDRSEIDHFDRLGGEWWNAGGEFELLHRMNPVRIGFLCDQARLRFGGDAASVHPFAGRTALDVGCGGGILAEPLARLGAQTTGIDASGEAIAAATEHAAAAGLDIAYRQETAEGLAATGAQFDIVTAMEIVEHVADMPAFLAALATLVKPGGLLAMSTLNRTARSFALAIVGAEYVMGWVARGTHDWRKFVRPSELAAGLRRQGLEVTAMAGMKLDPLRRQWSLAPHDLSINYLTAAGKP